MVRATMRLLRITLGLLLFICIFQQTEAKIKLKKLLKAGLLVGAIGSKSLPRFLPIPLPIPIRLDEEKTFGGGHFGSDYYSSLGSGFVPAYGSGGYNLGDGGFGGGVYGGGGYAAHGGWW